MGAIENVVIAKDMANSLRDAKNLSLKYLDTEGMLRAYILAYEGRATDKASSIAAIYVNDFAYFGSNEDEVDALLRKFLKLIKLKKNKSRKIIIAVKDQPSRSLLRCRLPQLAADLGIELLIQ